MVDPGASQPKPDKAIFWDFDGTLASRHGGWRAALVEALFAIDPTLHVSEESLREGLRAGFPWHQPEVGHPEIQTASQWWAAMAPIFERAYGLVGVSANVACLAAVSVKEHYCNAERFEVYPSVRGALELLSQHGWTHFIVSNHVPELPQLVKDLDLDVHFSGILTSALAGYEKPNERIFHQALSLAQTPTEAWMIGDNPIADVEGAQSAGIRAMLIRHGNDSSEDAVGLLDAVDAILA